MADLPKKLSPGEEEFALHCQLNGLTPEREYKFAEGRKYRFDFAWPRHKIAVEIEGGTWVQGRHNRGSSIESDMRKYNLAASLEWLVFKFTTDMVKSGEAINVIRPQLLNP